MKSEKKETPKVLDVNDICSDFDEDCEEVVANCLELSCYDYDPERGLCPYVCGHPEFTDSKERGNNEA